MSSDERSPEMTSYYTFQFRPAGAFANRFQQYEAGSEQEARNSR